MLSLTYIIIIMINILNDNFKNTDFEKFLKIAAASCFLSDIINICYIIFSYLPLSIDKLLLQNPIMNQAIKDLSLNSSEFNEFKSLFLNTFSSVFFFILIIHLIIYILLSRNNKWAKNYVSGYALLGGILTITTIPFMITSYGQWLWSFIMLLTCFIYLYIYIGLRYFKKQAL